MLDLTLLLLFEVVVLNLSFEPLNHCNPCLAIIPPTRPTALRARSPSPAGPFTHLGGDEMVEGVDLP